VGRLRDRRRGGGPARTIGGLTRTGTAGKVVGNKGGVQNPIVGEVDSGQVFEVFHDTDDPKIVDLPRSRVTGVFLMQACGYSDSDALPETNATTIEANWRFVEGVDKIAVWTDNQGCYFKFWVF